MTAIIVNFKSVIYQLILPTSQLLYLNQPNFIVNFKGETYKTIHSFPNFPTRNRLCKAIVKDGNFGGILQSFHRLGLASQGKPSSLSSLTSLSSIREKPEFDMLRQTKKFAKNDMTKNFIKHDPNYSLGGYQISKKF